VSEPEAIDLLSLQQITTDLATSARELNDAAKNIAEATRSQSNTSTITVNAGGLSAGLALSGVGTCLMMILLLGIWQMRAESDRKATQDAWLSVFQAEIAAIKSEVKAAKGEK